MASMCFSKISPSVDYCYPTTPVFFVEMRLVRSFSSGSLVWVFSLFVDCGWMKAADFLEVFQKFGGSLEFTGGSTSLNICKVWWVFCSACCHLPKIIIKQWRHALKEGECHENPVFPHGIEQRSLSVLVRDDKPFALSFIGTCIWRFCVSNWEKQFPLFLPLYQQTGASLSSQILKLGSVWALVVKGISIREAKLHNLATGYFSVIFLRPRARCMLKVLGLCSSWSSCLPPFSGTSPKPLPGATPGVWSVVQCEKFHGSLLKLHWTYLQIQDFY